MAFRKCASLCKCHVESFTFSRFCLNRCVFNKKRYSINDVVRYYARLSPNEVTGILRSNEHTEEVNYGSVKSFDTNQLPSNSPVEDSRAEARCLLTTGMLFGVFDGHGGPAAGQVTAKRLFNYLAASFLPPDVLHKLLNPNLSKDSEEILESYNDRFDLVEDLQKLYSQSLQNFLVNLSQKANEEFLMTSALENAFLRLDEDISFEAKKVKTIENDPKVAKSTDSLYVKTLSVALSGAVACVAHIDSEHLHIASCGDCKAVLGVWSSTSESWIAQPLTKDHNSDNPTEVARILSEHPDSEQDTVIRNDRLLGLLAPFRAFGDVRFKWTNSEVRDYVVPLLGEQSIVSGNSTPPYLTAKPEVFYHKLRAKDHFIILATDGLWDLLSPSQAVRLVGEHMSGKTILNPYSLPVNQDVTLGAIHKTLMRRMEFIKLKPTDVNAATHLIRHALGNTDQGIDHNKISHLLTLPDDAVRLFRDDITATVIFLDTEFLRQRPL